MYVYIYVLYDLIVPPRRKMHNSKVFQLRSSYFNVFEYDISSYLHTQVLAFRITAIKSFSRTSLSRASAFLNQWNTSTLATWNARKGVDFCLHSAISGETRSRSGNPRDGTRYSATCWRRQKKWHVLFLFSQASLEVLLQEGRAQDCQQEADLPIRSKSQGHAK